MDTNKHGVSVYLRSDNVTTSVMGKCREGRIKEERQTTQKNPVGFI